MSPNNSERVTYPTFRDREIEDIIFKRQKDAVISFTANWSSESQFLDHHNVRLLGEYPTLTCIKVDIETDIRLFKKYNLTKVPTTLIIKNGGVIQSIEGCPSYPSYLAKISDCLESWLRQKYLTMKEQGIIGFKDKNLKSQITTNIKIY